MITDPKKSGRKIYMLERKEPGTITMTLKEGGWKNLHGSG